MSGVSAKPATSPAQAAEDAFRRALISEMTHVRAFARSLCAGRQDEADDIAQEALAKAWASRASFTPTAPLRAWLFTIVRNVFRSGRRKAWRETLVDDMSSVGGTESGQAATAKIELDDARRALSVLDEDQREALVLTAVAGFSIEETAQICDTKPGTIKSRVARARARLERAFQAGEIGAASADRAPALDALIEEAQARAAGR